MIELELIQQSIAPELSLLNDKIREKLSSSNQLMQQVITSFLEKRGKQMRPMVVLLTAKMLGEINDNTICAAASVELLHNASLIHDDVVDNAMIRRGRPTINSIWDNHIAVLVGDFFVSTAMQQAIATKNVEIIDALCYLGKLLSMGELDQIYNARYHQLTEEAYYHIISYKTASLFVACAKMGCHSVGVTDHRLELVTEFAELLGRCFQIRDDIFDYYSDPAVGKPTGNDLKEGKITLPLLHVLLDEELPQAAAMRELSQKEELSEPEIATLISFAVDNGGIEYAYAQMERMRARAVDIISQLPDNDARRSLITLFDVIISREY